MMPDEGNEWTKGDGRWWTSESPHGPFMQLVKQIETRDVTRIQAYARDLESYGCDMSAFHRQTKAYNLMMEQVLFANQMRRVLDTIHAKLTRNQPLPQFVSTGGDYSQRARAKGLSLFTEGLFAAANAWQVGRQVCLDALLLGFGAVKVMRVGNQVRLERLAPWTVRMREQEAQHGLPRRIYYSDNFDRFALAADFPEHEREIMLAPRPTPTAGSVLFDGDSPDLVRVYEGWSLPTSRDADDGRHLITCGDTVLVDEAWEHEDFRIVFLRLQPPPIGWYPVSILRQVLPLQREYEYNLGKMQDIFRLCSHPHFLAANGSDISSEQMTNEPGTIWRYAGQPPQIFAPATMPPDLYRYIQELPMMMLSVSGVSAMSAQNQKPAGVTSGVALQTLDDVEAEGFLPMHKAYQDFFMELAKTAIEVAAEIGEDDPSYSVKVLGRGHAKDVRWSEVAMDRDDYVVRCTPISEFAKDFAARIDQAQQLLQLGALSVPQFREVLNLPDLQAESDMDLSDQHIIDKNIGAILADRTPVVAEPFDNLAMIIERGGKAYNLARLEDADPVSLELLRRYILSAHDLMQPAQPAQPPAPEGAPAPGAEPPTPAQPAGPAPALA